MNPMTDLFSAKSWRFGWHCSELMRLIFGFLTGVLPTLGALEWRGRWKRRPRSARGDQQHDRSKQSLCHTCTIVRKWSFHYPVQLQPGIGRKLTRPTNDLMGRRMLLQTCVALPLRRLRHPEHNIDPHRPGCYSHPRRKAREDR